MNHLPKHLLDIDHIDKDYIYDLLELTMKLKNDKSSFKKYDKNICALFYEDSTRTKLSFQKASSNLDLKFHNLDVSRSSLNKGESLYNTIKTINSIGMDLFIIRHPASGAANFLAKNTNSVVINAGDGSHAHPTQTLSDLFTIYELGKNFEDLEISIIGDIIFSRVARSNILGFLKMGSRINILGPKELISTEIIKTYESLSKSYKGRINVYEDLEEPIMNSDILMTLRIQKERFDSNINIDFETYKSRWQIDSDFVRKFEKEILIMHPGPVNEEIELSHEMVNSSISLISRQVENGVHVRQVLLEKLLIQNE